MNLPDFELLSVDPHIKDGGVFVRFRYLNLDGSTAALEVVEEQLREHVEKEGGLPSWAGLERSHIWVVKGRPWLEVCRLIVFCVPQSSSSCYTGYETFSFTHLKSHVRRT